MRFWWAILLMAFILSIPIFMYWWNEQRSKVEIKELGSGETPILGRKFN